MIPERKEPMGQGMKPAHLSPGLAESVPERVRQVPGAPRVNKAPDLDAPARRPDEVLAELPPRPVSSVDVHLERDGRCRTVHGVEHGRKFLCAVFEETDGGHKRNDTGCSMHDAG